MYDLQKWNPAGVRFHRQASNLQCFYCISMFFMEAIRDFLKSRCSRVCFNSAWLSLWKGVNYRSTKSHTILHTTVRGTVF